MTPLRRLKRKRLLFSHHLEPWLTALTRRYAVDWPLLPARMRHPSWLGPQHRQQLLVFVHIPKAGGTSLNDVLGQVYGSGFAPFHAKQSRFDPADVTAEEARRILALAGHFRFGFHGRLGCRSRRGNHPDGLFAGRDIRYVSVVRDPVERMSSYYRYVTSFPGHRLYQDTRGMDVRAFVDFVGRLPGWEGRNQQCRMLGDAPTAAQAIERIENDYLAVVALDNLAGLVSFLQRELGWPEGRAVLRHKNRSRGCLSACDRQYVEDWCSEHCAEDRALFDYVRDGVSGRAHNLPTLQV